MKKNKEIVIELTALLDVIFIMLFWVMINVRESNVKVKEDADSRVAAAQAQVVQVKQETASQLESMREQTDSEIKRVQEQMERIDKNAAANQQALDNFGDGQMLTLNLRYQPGGKLVILRDGDELASTEVTSSNEVYTAMTDALDSGGTEKHAVILCAFVYDGSHALYRDVSEISDAVTRVGKTYRNFYCTFINTAR